MTELIGQLKTCLASQNSCLAGRAYHAECSTIKIYDGHHSHGQCYGHRTHPDHNGHVEEIEKGREYLAEAYFSQGDNKRQVTSYID